MDKPNVEPGSLGDEEVHLWWTRLDVEVRRLDALRRLLAHEETERAARFKFPRDERRWVVARAQLRRMLGGYLRCDPSHLHFRYNCQGKPSLGEKTPLDFNVSHSGDIAVYAVTSGRRVGIDVECFNGQFASFEIADTFFTNTEAAFIRVTPAEHRQEAFLRCWTLKEAYIKAIGLGLSQPLDSFTVPAVNALGETLESDSVPPGWTFRQFDPEAGYCGAVAVEGEGIGISQCGRLKTG